MLRHIGRHHHRTPLSLQFAEFSSIRGCGYVSYLLARSKSFSSSLTQVTARHSIQTLCSQTAEGEGRSMAGLQRSSQTFRRSGSSGLVWDERLMSHDGNQREPEDAAMESKELRHSRSVGSVGLQLQRRRNDDSSQGFRTRHVAPALDPPSPKVPGCIFCGIFRKAGASQPSKPRRY